METEKPDQPPEPEPEEDVEANEMVEKAIAGAVVVKNKVGAVVSREAEDIFDKWGDRVKAALKGFLTGLEGKK